ncbi:hypothetical protein HJC23_000883 [Cyclotella cryptica]|uniref:Peptide chain release factor N(5)-glutamine methyltransferase n=1 Tax=Cyclotella cryptica TaxID=29204 RepID=A0ABD3PV76_9STRA
MRFSFSTNRFKNTSRWIGHFHSQNPADIEPNADIPSVQRSIGPDCTVYDALRSSIELLQKQSIPEPVESALHLLSFALNLNWETGYRQLRAIMEMTPPPHNRVQPIASPAHNLAQQALTSEQSTSYNSMLERRLQHEPIQYIIGKWDFHHLMGIMIRKPMLCPRPETEELVELVSGDIRRLIKERALDNGNVNENKIRILDVGAGTGAIGIALAYQYPWDVQVVALDVLEEAVELSNHNAEKFLSPLISNEKSDEQIDVRSLYNAMLCSAKDFTNFSTAAERQDHQKQRHTMGFDIVVSNPPYIPLGDMDGLSMDVLQYESREALCGGHDGLDIIRDIIQRLPEWTSCSNDKESSSQMRYCWMEVDDSHPRLLEKWLAPGSAEAKLYGVEYCECQKDFCGRDRFVKFRVL